MSTYITFMIRYAPLYPNTAAVFQILFEIAVYRPEETTWIVSLIETSSAFAIIHKSIILITRISLRHIISEKNIIIQF